MPWLGTAIGKSIHPGTWIIADVFLQFHLVVVDASEVDFLEQRTVFIIQDQPNGVSIPVCVGDRHAKISIHVIDDE